MSKTDVIEIEGKVIEKLPNAMFQVELERIRAIRKEKENDAKRNRK